MKDDDDLVVLRRAELIAAIEAAVRAVMGPLFAPLLVNKLVLSKLLGSSPAHIDNLRKRGLPIVKVGDSVRFEPLAVLAWLKNAPENEVTP